MIKRLVKLVFPPFFLIAIHRLLLMVGWRRKFKPGNFGEVTPSNYEKFQKNGYLNFYKFYKKTVDEKFFQNWILSKVSPNEDVLPLLLSRSTNRRLEKINFFSSLDNLDLHNVWMPFLERGKIDNSSLSEYYNSKQVIAFTFAKIRDDRWLASRLLPLLLLNNLGSKTYLEDGGADGLLPFFASLVCEQSINVELSDLQREFSSQLAHNCGHKNFAVAKSLQEIKDDSIDIISSHQLLEHLQSPEDQLFLYRKKLKNCGFIICSTGFNLHPWPGHLPSSIAYAGREKLLFEGNGFIPHELNDLCFAFLGVMLYQKVL